MAKLAIKGGAKLFPKGWVGPRWPQYTEEDRRQLQEVLDGSIWCATSLGPKIKELNERWAAYCGTRRSVALANGTVTMELALRARGIGPGDEVIVPAWTFMATAIVVVQVGATPVFVDVDPNTMDIAPARIEEAITERTRAIIPVHFGGHPCDMDRIMEIARSRQLVVIEDAAQAHGAIWRGLKMGKFGDCGSYSFQQAKNLQCGEGGSLVTDDEALADRIHYSLSKFGRGIGKEYRPYTHHELAGNANMTEFQAAIVLAQLTQLEQQTETRVQRAAVLREWLSQIEGIMPLPVDPRVDRHGWHLFMFRYDCQAFSGLSKQDFCRAVTAEGVWCNPMYERPLYREPMYDLERMAVRGTDVPIRVMPCPECERAPHDLACFPQTMLLADMAELEMIPSAIQKIKDNLDELLASS
jgi:dTDP-4-amino-4,6-dideoxygalactose transaminase